MSVVLGSESPVPELPSGLEILQIKNRDGEVVQDMNHELYRFAGLTAERILSEIDQGKQVLLQIPISGALPYYSAIVEHIENGKLSTDNGPIGIFNNLHFQFIATAGDKKQECGDRKLAMTPISLSNEMPLAIMLCDDIVDDGNTRSDIRRVTEQFLSTKYPYLTPEFSEWYIGVKQPKVYGQIAAGTEVHYHLDLPNRWLNSGAGLNSDHYDFTECLTDDNAAQVLHSGTLERLAPVVTSGKPAFSSEYYDWLKQYESEILSQSFLTRAYSFLTKIDAVYLASRNQDRSSAIFLQSLLTNVQFQHIQEWKNIMGIKTAGV